MRKDAVADAVTITFREGPGAYRATFDPGSVPVSDALVWVVSEVAGDRDGRHESVADVVDPIVLDALVRRRRREVAVSFTFSDHEVTVRSDGEIVLLPPDEVTDPRAGSAAFEEGGSVSDATIRAIARAKGEDPTELAPLYEQFDPGVLDELFDRMRRPGERELRLSFLVGEHEVIVHGDGRVVVRSPDVLGNADDDHR